MIRLQNGGAVREVSTQREADYYTGFGYKVVSTGQDEKDVPEVPDNGAKGKAPEDNSGDKKKSGGSGKKSAAKEE